MLNLNKSFTSYQFMNRSYSVKYGQKWIEASEFFLNLTPFFAQKDNCLILFTIIEAVFPPVLKLTNQFDPKPMRFA